MDIEYLLMLQRFREGPGAFLAPLMNWVSKLSVSFIPVAMLCTILVPRFMHFTAQRLARKNN